MNNRDRSQCSWLDSSTASNRNNAVIGIIGTTKNVPSAVDLSLKIISTIAEYLPTSKKELAPEQAGLMMILSGSPQGQLEQQQPYYVKIVNGTAVSSSAIPLTRSGVLSFPTCFKVVAELFTGAFSKKELTA